MRLKGKSGYIVLGCLTLTVMGLLFAWSLYVDTLESDLGWSRAQSSVVYTVSTCMFSVGGILGGIFHNRLGVSKVLLLGGILGAAGYFVSSITSSIPIMAICYGGLTGIATGLAYNNIIAAVTSWYKADTGLVSGILLMFYGFGTMILGPVITLIIQNMGWRMSFRFVGTAFFLFSLICSFVIRDNPSTEQIPDTKHTRAPKDFSTTEMLRSPIFLTIYPMTFFVCSVGAAIIGIVSSCAVFFGASTWTAVICASLVSITNGVGRIVYGTMYDRIGMRKTYFIMTIVTLAASLLLFIGSVLGMLPVLMIGFFLAGLSYAGLGPANPVLARRVFGEKYYNVNLGFIASSGLPAAFLGPLFLGSIDSYSVIFGICVGYSIIAILLVLAGIRGIDNLEKEYNSKIF